MTEEPTKLLVVDDEPELINSLKGTLESAGYTVLTSMDGGSALEKARMELPDLILLDLGLPKLDGHHLLKILRQEEACREIPVIVITAKEETKELASTLDQGAFSYCVKPVRLDTLLVLIQTVLQRSS